MKKLDRDHFEQLVGLADAYLMGELDAAGLSALELMVCEDPAAAEALAQYLRQAGALREGLAESAKAERESSEPKLSEYLSILSELDGAEPQPVDLTDELARRKTAEFERRRRRSAVIDAESSVARVAMIPRPLVWLAGAAAILLLAFVFWPDATTPQGPDSQAETLGPARVVATLTAQHNARWSSAPLAPGDALVAGQRLTLTEGFAEITTVRGAVAIVEAPCTVETIDSANALRLIHGKLVGICESESSQGFLVRTPHMDVTDLGTEFGVKADNDLTEILVFEGSVAVSKASAKSTQGRPSLVFAGQSAQATNATDVIDVGYGSTPASAFVRRDEFWARRVADHGSAYDRWLASTYDIKRMRGLVLYYPMGGAPDDAGILINQAPQFVGEMNGLLGERAGIGQNPQWGSGRFEGKKALDYRLVPSACVLVPHDERLNLGKAVTLCVWAKLVFNGNSAHSFLNKRTSQDGSCNFHMAVLSPQFDPEVFPPASIQFSSGEKVHTGTQAPENTLRHSDANVVPDGEWVYLVVAADHKETRFYVNGRLVSTREGQQLTANEADLLLGASLDWDVDPEESRRVRPDYRFNGEIDEVAIFSVALASDEIERMYQGGAPPGHAFNRKNGQ